MAVISGGSSGIGLACARRLLMRGYRVVLLARDMERLRTAQAELGPAFMGASEIVSADVDDAGACRAALETVMRRHGRIDWLITSAGVAEIGMFRDLDLAAHRAQMQTNYFGTLNLVHAAVPLMRRSASRITLVSSGAAFLGIVGHSAYAPGKFAVRALAEILRLELEPEGIVVSVAFPPDTETPQLARERQRSPAVTRMISKQGGTLSADAVAERLVDRAERGRFIVTMGWPLAFLAWWHSLYRPVLARQQRRLLHRSIGDDAASLSR